MGRVTASARFPQRVHTAERVWYDTARWPDFVDELARVVQVTEGWPEAGSAVVWESGPAGRGRVTERVTVYEIRRGQTVEVEDDSITGVQTVAFAPAGDGGEVTLVLEYRIKRRNPLTSLVDLLFVRRLMAQSLERTLSRFGAVLSGPADEQAR